ncbi:UNVERIFIED_CONTAM: hypothetical protein Cloal_2812 [Acetivibrio alkalicellulosi]
MKLKTNFQGSYRKLIRRIKKDLFISLQKKGVNISNVNVALRKNKLKLKMCIRE